MTTATTTAVATSTTVHRVMPNFTALYEGDVVWDACGPVANEVAVAALERRKPSAATAIAIRARDLQARRFAVKSGQTLDDIHWDLTAQRGYPIAAYIPYSASPDLARIHETIKAATSDGQPAIAELTRAYALPGNERGVYGHFVVLGGIDSALGYLVANGDTVDFITAYNAHRQVYQDAQQMRWATWAQLVAAGIAGVIVVHPKPTPVVAPHPATDDGDAATIKALQAQVTALATTAQAALTLAQRIETGLKNL